MEVRPAPALAPAGSACDASKRAFGLFSRVCQIRFDLSFRLRHVFSSKSIAPNRGSRDFLKRTPEACTNLSYGRFVFCWEWRGDRSIGGANLRKGLCPFIGWHASCPHLAPVPCLVGGIAPVLYRKRMEGIGGVPVCVCQSELF